MPKQFKEGDKCPICYDVLRKVERSDYRSEENQRKYPLTDAQRFILACRCLHPGDYIIGGFF